MRSCIILSVLLLGIPLALARGQEPTTQIVVRPIDITWQPGPPVLEPGAEAAILAGHPAQAGALVIRVRVPGKYRIAPHRHSGAEYVTILSGTLCFQISERGLSTQGTCVGPGGFVLIPANVPHAVLASAAAEYQINAAGPFEMTYLNPADDPSQRQR